MTIPQEPGTLQDAKHPGFVDPSRRAWHESIELNIPRSKLDVKRKKVLSSSSLFKLLSSCRSGATALELLLGQSF